MDVLVLDEGRVFHEPLAEPVDGCTFGDADGAVKRASEVIFDDKETGFTIETFVGGSAGLILGSLASESEVDGETLPWSGGFHRRRMTMCALLHLSSEAGGAVVKDRSVVLERRHASDVLMSMVQVVIATVSKALMPEETIGSNREAVKVELAFDGGDSIVGIRDKGTEMEVGRRRSSGDSRRGRQLWQEERLSVT